MSRLLHAAARGARVQRYSIHVEEWVVVPVGAYPSNQLRIHPDDEHLAYGPISSALREYARTGGWPTNYWALPASMMLKQHNEGCSFVPMKDETAVTLALILSEFAADEGL